MLEYLFFILALLMVHMGGYLHCVHCPSGRDRPGIRDLENNHENHENNPQKQHPKSQNLIQNDTNCHLAQYILEKMEHLALHKATWRVRIRSFHREDDRQTRPLLALFMRYTVLGEATCFSVFPHPWCIRTALMLLLNNLC